MQDLYEFVRQRHNVHNVIKKSTTSIFTLYKRFENTYATEAQLVALSSMTRVITSDANAPKEGL